LLIKVWEERMPRTLSLAIYTFETTYSKFSGWPALAFREISMSDPCWDVEKISMSSVP
jgi:hypothetical protein